MHPLRLIAAAGALGIAAGGWPAAAAWSPPQRASTGPGDAHSPDVAVDGRGDAAAAWVQEAGPRGRIVASVRRAGGAWSPPTPVSPPGGSAVDPRVAIDARGRVVAVWRQVVRTRVLLGRRQAVYVARARERGLGAGWGPVATLSDDRQKVGAPELAIDGRGVAIAAWHWGTGTAAGTPGHVGLVQVAERRPGRGWGRARAASRRGRCALDTRLPHVAAGAGGGALVWWQCDLPAGHSATDAIGRGPSPGAWSAPRRLPFDAAGDQMADLAVAADGTVVALTARDGALAAWRGASALGGSGGLTLAPGPLPAPQRLGRDGGRPAVAPAAGGWILGCGAGVCGGLGLADLGAGGAVERVTALGGPPRARRDARVASGADGSAVAVALSAGGVVASSRAPGADWTAPERISAGGSIEAQSARVGVGAAVAAVAYWTRTVGGRRVVERAALESAG